MPQRYLDHNVVPKLELTHWACRRFYPKFSVMTENWWVDIWKTSLDDLWEKSVTELLMMMVTENRVGKITNLSTYAHWVMLTLIRILFLMLVTENATVKQMSKPIQSHQHFLPFTDHSLMESFGNFDDSYWEFAEQDLPPTRILCQSLISDKWSEFWQEDFAQQIRNQSYQDSLNGILWKFLKWLHWWYRWGHLLSTIFLQS